MSMYLIFISSLPRETFKRLKMSKGFYIQGFKKKEVDSQKRLILKLLTRFSRLCIVKVGLDHSVYQVGQEVLVSVMLHSRPARRLTKVSVTACQAVDVAMFSSGFFKVAASYFSEGFKVEQKSVE